MTIPDTTSAEAIDHYVVERDSREQGTAWRDVRLSVIALPPVADTFTMPTVSSEPRACRHRSIRSSSDGRRRRLMRETKKSVITIANEVGVCVLAGSTCVACSQARPALFLVAAAALLLLFIGIHNAWTPSHITSCEPGKQPEIKQPTKTEGNSGLMRDI